MLFFFRLVSHKKQRSISDPGQKREQTFPESLGGTQIKKKVSNVLLIHSSDKVQFIR
jgi:hypothetical protein